MWIHALIMTLKPISNRTLCASVCVNWTWALSSSRCFWPLSSALICVRHLRLWSSSLRLFDSLSSPWIIPYCCFFWVSSSAANSWLGTHLTPFSEKPPSYKLNATQGWRQNGTKQTKSPKIQGWLLKDWFRPFPHRGHLSIGLKKN